MGDALPRRAATVIAALKSPTKRVLARCEDVSARGTANFAQTVFSTGFNGRLAERVCLPLG
jgi:hypothetical protein